MAAPREGMEILDDIYGKITAQRFVMENLYAVILATNSDPLASARRTRDEMLRQFELPAINAADVADEGGYAVSQIALHHLESFWDAVEQRLGAVPTK